MLTKRVVPGRLFIVQNSIGLGSIGLGSIEQGSIEQVFIASF